MTSRARVTAVVLALLAAPAPAQQPAGDVEPATIVVTGTDAWRDEGPLRFALLEAGEGAPGRAIALRDGEPAPLPPAGSGARHLVVRTNRDDVLALLPVEDGGGTQRLVLPPPVAFALEVRDENGEPVAGATVRHRAARLPERDDDPFASVPRFCWRTLGVTDAQGRLRVRLPVRGDPFAADPEQQPAECVLAVDRDGHARGIAGFAGRRPTDATAIDAVERVLRVALAPAAPFRVELRRGGEPVAGEAVTVLAREVAAQQEGMQFVVAELEHELAAVTGADGVATFDAMPLGAGEFRLVRTAADGAPRCVPLPSQRRGTLAVDLAESGDVTVHVTGAAGGGARCTGVAMCWQPGELLLQPFGCEPRFATGDDGRAAVRLMVGRWWVFVHDGASFAHRLVDVARDGAAVELALRPYAEWTLQVQDGSGRAAAGARFAGHGQQWIDGAAIPEDLLARQFLGVLDGRLAAGARADAGGRLVVRFAPPEVMTTFGRVRWRGRESAELHLRPGAPQPVVVR